MANPWKFYFADAEGKSVLRLKAGAVLPLTAPGDPEVIPADFVPGQSQEYSYKHNSVGYDDEKGLTIDELPSREMYYNDRLIIKNGDYSQEEGIVIMKR